MFKVFILSFFVSTLSYMASCAENNVEAVRDLNTAETFWDVFNGRGYTGGYSNGYSGWGTGVQVQSRPTYGTYSYASPYGYGAYGGYGSYPYGSYGNTGNSNYYGKYPVYAGYTSNQPTYENYGIHGGHGFGKYGNY